MGWWGRVIGALLRGLPGALVGDLVQEVRGAKNQGSVPSPMGTVCGCVAALEGRSLAAGVAISVDGSDLARVFDKGQRIPCKRTQTLRTNTDEQLLLEFAVYQGDGVSPTDITELQLFRICGLPGGPKGRAVRIKLKIDRHGRLNLEAKDGQTGGKLEAIHAL